MNRRTMGLKIIQKKLFRNWGRILLKGQIQSVVNFHSSLNKHIKQNYPGIITCLFSYANTGDVTVQIAATTKYLDYFGCDGRPWGPSDKRKKNHGGKVLLGKNKGERFLKAAHEHGKKSLWLAENHAMGNHDVQLMKKRYRAVLAKDIDQLIYYYYPRSLQDPDYNMKVVGHYIKEFKKG